MGKKRPDPQLLLTGDIVHCDGGPDAFSAITRIVTGPKTKNIFQRLRDHNISTHTGIIATFAGQRFVVEMRPNGCEPNSIEFYRVPAGQKPREVLAVHRIARMTDADRAVLDAAMALDIRRGIEYAFKDLPRFVFEKVKADKRRMYCSEYVWARVKQFFTYAPPSFDVIVSPQQLYTFCSDRYTRDTQEVWHR